MAKKKKSKEGLNVEDLSRGADLTLSKQVKDEKKLRARLKATERRSRDVIRSAQYEQIANTELSGFVEADHPLERTFKFSQADLVAESDNATKRRASFQLDLSETKLGPYGGVYSPSGKTVLLYGRKGHVSLTDWNKLALHSEIHLNETIRDATFLHNDSFYALAQGKYVSIYDSSSIELHTMRNHADPLRLAFLPYHFLLSSLSESGALNYSDTSTGEVVAELKTAKLGRGTSLALNQHNGCLSVGHANGTVSLWSPVTSDPLARILTHRGAVNAIAFTADGRTMITAGADAKLNLWDLRTYQKLHFHFLPSPVKSVAVSQRGVLAAGFGNQVYTWRSSAKAATRGDSAPYLVNKYGRKPIERLDFCPFEDVLGVSHSAGFSTMIVPGAGEPNFDSSLPNPFETAKQRRERQISSLLDKLKPETIGLDPNVVGGLDPDPSERLQEIRRRQREANAQRRKKTLEKNRTRGRNKISKKLKRKQANVIDAKTERLREEKLERERAQQQKSSATAGMTEEIAPMLKRFVKKKYD